jgi:hypothetical protein
VERGGVGDIEAALRTLPVLYDDDQNSNQRNHERQDPQQDPDAGGRLAFPATSCSFEQADRPSDDGEKPHQVRPNRGKQQIDAERQDAKNQACGCEAVSRSRRGAFRRLAAGALRPTAALIRLTAGLPGLTTVRFGFLRRGSLDGDALDSEASYISLSFPRRHGWIVRLRARNANVTYWEDRPGRGLRRSGPGKRRRGPAPTCCRAALVLWGWPPGDVKRPREGARTIRFFR